MIRFLIDQFRTAPGPLKNPRILIADLSEEIIDLAKHYLTDDTKCDSEMYPCMSNPSHEYKPKSKNKPSVEVKSETETKTEAETKPKAKAKSDTKPKEKKEAKKEAKTKAVDKQDTEPAFSKKQFKAALNLEANKKKQPFKILASLFDADNKKMGPLLSKEVANYTSEKLDMHIKQENVRKVIRLKLSDYVNVHAHGVGKSTVYRYEISAPGRIYFISTFLNN